MRNGFTYLLIRMSENTNTVPEKFITSLQGQQFILFEGLLDLFHKNGGNEVKTQVISIEPFIIKATVSGDKGIFEGIGDADESNVNRNILKHRYRMAETRAIARALRWYNNIGMTTAEEIGGDEQNKSELKTTSQTQPKQNEGDFEWVSEDMKNKILNKIKEDGGLYSSDGQKFEDADKFKKYMYKQGYKMKNAYKDEIQEAINNVGDTEEEF